MSWQQQSGSGAQADARVLTRDVAALDVAIARPCGCRLRHRDVHREWDVHQALCETGEALLHSRQRVADVDIGDDRLVVKEAWAGGNRDGAGTGVMSEMLGDGGEAAVGRHGRTLQ